MSTGGIIAAVVGLLVGLVLALLGLFDLKKVEEKKRAYVRISCVIIGVLFVVLAIMTFAGVFGSSSRP